MTEIKTESTRHEKKLLVMTILLSFCGTFLNSPFTAVYVVGVARARIYMRRRRSTTYYVFGTIHGYSLRWLVNEQDSSMFNLLQDS